jgi:glycosyltransferase involved in cell wall biosynthesis
MVTHIPDQSLSAIPIPGAFAGDERIQLLYTVCTPTYNREKLLPRVYASLREQTFVDFEWLVVDDGSTDGTADLVRRWAAEAPFPIRYVWKENGGKHTAHNVCIREARGELFVMVDSDDWLVPDALERLKAEWDRIPQKNNYSGVCCLFQYEDGSIVGNKFPGDRIESNAVDLRYNLGVAGDKIGFIRTDVLRRFPFPDDLGRQYVPESLVWNRISQEYQMRCVNVVIGVKEYQPEGITDRSRLNSYRNPLAYYLCGAELLNGRIEIPLKRVPRVAVSLAKCALLARKSPFVARRPLHWLASVAVLPAGALLALRDWWRAKRAGRIRPAGSRSNVGVRIHSANR